MKNIDNLAAIEAMEKQLMEELKELEGRGILGDILGDIYRPTGIVDNRSLVFFSRAKRKNEIKKQLRLLREMKKKFS